MGPDTDPSGHLESGFAVLVVCLGNVCRSPLAERVLRLRLRGTAEVVAVSSAGVLAVVGCSMDESTAHELERLGGDPAGHQARQLTAPMVQVADLILCATTDLRSRVLEEFPAALRRTFTIREFAALTASNEFRTRRATSPTDLVRRSALGKSSLALAQYDVLDPIGRTPAFHRAVAEVVDTECTHIARAVVDAIAAHIGAEQPASHGA